MDIVEEFLELGRQVIWPQSQWRINLWNWWDAQSIVLLNKPRSAWQLWERCWKLSVGDSPEDTYRILACADFCVDQYPLIIIHEIIWSQILCLRKSMQDLLRTQCDAGRNAPRDFWRWIDRQPWRRMLLFPMEHPGFLFTNILYNIYDIDHCRSLACFKLYPFTFAIDTWGSAQCWRTRRWRSAMSWDLGTFFYRLKCVLEKNFEINIAGLNQFHFDTLKHSLSKFCRVCRVRF